jgi:dTDP-4-dehydrorhamnose 3,5-epimerase
VRVLPTVLEGPILLQATVHGDGRGFFVETFRESALADAGVRERWVQDNHSRSERGVVRGMHFSVGPGQAKLVRCARGRVLDVVVDLRRGSPAFGRWESFELDDLGGRMVYVPVGFAHGFCVLSEVADVVYKCSAYYDPDLERGFAWDDEDVGIEWPELDVALSARDATAPRLREIADEIPFTYAAERSSAI